MSLKKYKYTMATIIDISNDRTGTDNQIIGQINGLNVITIPDHIVQLNLVAQQGVNQISMISGSRDLEISLITGKLA